MVFCTYCGQSFTRDEHLERHILTHTNVKPFKCFTCHMSFARRDLLQRHYTVHGRDQNQQELPPSDGIIPKSAGRTPIACSNCAKTKTRCDKKFPCSRCASRNLKCTLRPTKRSTKNAQRMGIPLEGAVAVPPYDNTSTDANANAVPPPGNITSPQEQGNAQPSDQSSFAESSEPSPPPAQTPHDGKNEGQTHAGYDPSGSMPQMSSPASQHLVNGPSALTQQYPHRPAHQHAHQMTHFSEYGPIDGIPAGEDSTPHFMLDWSQLQIPMGYDGMVQPSMIMDPELTLGYTGFDFEPNPNMMLPLLPEDIGGPLLTPTETPEGCSYSDYEPRGSTSRSSVSQSFDQDMDVDVQTVGHEAWSVFRCAKAAATQQCPKTARLNLELLEQALKNYESWINWSSKPGDVLLGDHREPLGVIQLREGTRDKLLAFTQSFLHRAMDATKGDDLRFTPGNLPSPHTSTESSFFLLPPARVLEHLLRSYSNSFERYFPITARGVLDVNELVHGHDGQTAYLLVLMMIAQGAINTSSHEAHMLTAGLTEACRAPLFEKLERDGLMSNAPLMLHASLLFTIQAAWSGDKWQMDASMDKRGMLLAMLRHSGLLEYTSPSPRTPDRQIGVTELWTDWTRDERLSRLVYSWVMADQDLALMHDTTPLISVTELGIPMPDTDRLWQAKDSASWSSTFEQVHEFSGGYSSVGSGARPLSLRELFRHFLDDEMVPLGIEMTPLQLRLLLYPLQSLVCQYTQLLSCFSHKASGTGSLSLAVMSTKSRLAEVQTLLQRWQDLAERYLKTNSACAVMQTNLIIFHLLSLNTITNFPEIERLARNMTGDEQYQQLQRSHATCIHDVEQAIYHCGQALRQVRSMPRGIRPPWWAGAVYRVALVFWTDSLLQKSGTTQNVNGMYPVPGPSFVVDALPSDHPLVVRYLRKREGVPCVTKRDGSQVNIDDSFHILQHCVEVIDEGFATQFSSGIRAKLQGLAHG